MSGRITLSMQIEEAARETSMREQVYPRLVYSGKLRRGEAEHQLMRMKAIKRTLEWFRENEQVIVDAVRKQAVQS